MAKVCTTQALNYKTTKGQPKLPFKYGMLLIISSYIFKPAVRAHSYGQAKNK
jgi:hypothetical protein